MLFLTNWEMSQTSVVNKPQATDVLDRSKP